MIRHTLVDVAAKGMVNVIITLLETVQYDTIYHEHLRYYSLHSIQYLLQSHGLRVSTFINYVGLDDGILPCVLEVASSGKIGKYMPGKNIPVLEESKLYEDQPAYALLLSWHIADELMKNLKKRGYKGDFIVPLPSPHVVENTAVIPSCI